MVNTCYYSKILVNGSIKLLHKIRSRSQFDASYLSKKTLMQVEISFVYSFFAKGKLVAYMIINSPFF